MKTPEIRPENGARFARTFILTTIALWVICGLSIGGLAIARALRGAPPPRFVGVLFTGLVVVVFVMNGVALRMIFTRLDSRP